MSETATQRDVEEILGDWPEEATEVAEKVIDDYGEPDEAVPSRLIWFDTGPWKYTVVYREGVGHEFPDFHTDYVEQAIDFKVPPDRVGNLANFDGSVTYRRTRGELTAECHGEPANYLALNLAHDIVTGEKSVAEAREVYSEIYARKEAGDEPDYIQDLHFSVPEGDQRDPDHPTLTDEIEERAQEYVD